MINNDIVLPTLHILCGLPRSGKSTHAITMGYPVVSPDAIRLALHGMAFYPDAEPMVWAMAQNMVRSLFLSGHRDVILDACNATQRRRKTWEKPDDWDALFIHIPTALEVCLQRADLSQGGGVHDVIRRMHSNWEPFRDDQAYVVIEPNLDNELTMLGIKDRMRVAVEDDRMPPNQAALLSLEVLTGDDEP